MKKYRFLSLLLLIPLVLSLVLPAAALEEPEVYCDHAVLLDANHGEVLYDKNAYELLAQPDIDGGLIGGASLVPEKFVKIIESANQNAE